MAVGSINQKVPWGAGGAAGGSLVGAAVADLLMTFLRSGLGLQLTETNESSITIIVVMLLSAAGSFLSAYLKPSGFTVGEQQADLQVAKAIEKATEQSAETARAAEKEEKKK